MFRNKRWSKICTAKFTSRLFLIFSRQEVKRKLNQDKEAAKAIEELFEAKKMDEMLEYIQMYANSVDTDDEKDNCSKKARELYQYLNNNREGLIFNIRLTEIITRLSASNAPKKDGKGNPYIDVINMHVPMRDAVQTALRRVLAKAFDILSGMAYTFRSK